MQPTSTNGFFGTKLSKTGINVNEASDAQLLYQQDFTTGTQTWFGTTYPVMQAGPLPEGGYGLRFPDANGIGIAQFGQFPDGSTALKIAPTGVEVATATDSQLIFNSSQDIFKIVQTGNLSIPTTPSTFINVAHNLGYEPIVMAYITFSWSSTPVVTTSLPAMLVAFSTTAGGFVIDYLVSFQVTTTNIVFRFDYVNGGTFSGTINYYILQESATPS